ncbi:hypothetical protein MsedC_2318 [Metallosphaera sedula]|uniref:Uncharacterized protein n=2 Tax=Metallosphaera TaxID=41980 RepID=A0A0K1SYG5_9CREN|nr:hypothetical protein MsedB_2321 [Metallosphaera sedula]AKV79661.1 hypothetical protein MsedC_2318 [Metallosphaera sedula]AKV81906.1 hypothetical protein MsedD_2319 [Metallosphaera sedula]AKV84142.1 hypothetical protein MsedE_2322 [Metallosphaera sedula]QCO30248.1 hypothetical protein DFR88_06885 [Metallosphaera prunae]
MDELEILELTVGNGLDVRSLIKYDENCVTQVVLRLPPVSVIRQACYIFFNGKYKTKIRDKTLYFLTLLNSTDQLSIAMRNTVPKDYEGIAYLIKCCKSDIITDQLKISSNQERISLSMNAVLSLG